jgi:hypothetical protein
MRWISSASQILFSARRQRLRNNPSAIFILESPGVAIAMSKAFESIAGVQSCLATLPLVSMFQLRLPCSLYTALYIMLNGQFESDAVRDNLRSHLFDDVQLPNWEPFERYVPDLFSDARWRSEGLFPTGPRRTGG